MPANKQSKQPSSGQLVIASAVAAAFVGFLAGFLAGQPAISGRINSWIEQQLIGGPAIVTSIVRPADSVPTATGSQNGYVSEEERRIATVERTAPAVVSVVVTKDVPVFEQYYSNPFGDSFFNDFFGDFNFGMPQLRQKGTERQEVGAGTGFIVSADGLIVTNKHVVLDEEAEYTVITSDGEQHDAEVLGRDPANDLAVLRITPEDGAIFPHISFATEEPRVGQSVIAIGYALGEFSNTVSTGIVSGLARDITAGDSRGNSERLYDVIQTDAAINPGNSGGPLLNLAGRAIGVNVAVERGAQGIGFALPISDVRRVVDSVIETGKISRPFLGVRYIMINPDVAQANQLPYEYGALVVRGERQIDLAVTPGSPADLAGIVENDIILEINGQQLTADQPLAHVVRNLQAGSSITMKIFHKGEEKELQVELAERE
jgi:S1-C subfamily serine protease